MSPGKSSVPVMGSHIRCPDKQYEEHTHTCSTSSIPASVLEQSDFLKEPLHTRASPRQMRM